MADARGELARYRALSGIVLVGLRSAPQRRRRWARAQGSCDERIPPDSRSSYLMGLSRPATTALEQVMGAKGDKLPLLLSPGAGQHPLDRRGEVVVNDEFGNPAQSLE